MLSFRCHYLKQWVWQEQFYLLVRCFFSIAPKADELFYLLQEGFFSMRDKFMVHWLTTLRFRILEVYANPWLLAIFQLADC